MASRASSERPEAAFDTGDDDPVGGSPAPTIADLAELAEAEAAAAEAEAHAAAARAHATRLRWKVTGGEETPEISGSPSQRWRLHRPGWRGAAITLLCAALGASGYILWNHHVASQERQRTAEFAAAARQAVATLMSLDFTKAEQDMQSIAAISTGRFRDAFPVLAEQLTNRLQASKVATQATVNDVAVESSTDNSATVLVAATTEATGAQAAQAAQGKAAENPEPQQYWHIALHLTMDGGQPKMSSIEFVE